MRLLFACICVAVLGIASIVDAAPTGYANDFTDNAAKWPANPGYKVSQADGIVSLQVAKEVPWAAQIMQFGDVYDFSAHPYVNVKIKSSAPVILDVYLRTEKGAVNVARRIRAVGDFQNYCFDFPDVKSIDSHAVTGLIFCANGAANSWVGTIQLKELRVGDKAAMLPSVEAVEDQEWYHDSGKHTALLTGVEYVKQFTLTGAEKLVRNVAFSSIEHGHCTMSYELIPGASGKLQATLTAVGDDDYASVTRTFTMLVEDNLPPTIDLHTPVTAQVGKPLSVRFTGVSGGNFTAYKPLTITVKSSNAEILAEHDLQAENPNGGRYLYLSGTPKKAGDTEITLTLDDKSGGNGITTTKLKIHAVPQWNNPPTLDPIADSQAFLAGGDQQLKLNGISDGNDGKQPLTFTAVSSDTSILPNPTVVYTGGDTAILHYTPTAIAGMAKVTVTVTNHGGTPDNNGDQSVSQTFAMTTRVRPISGYTVNLADFVALKPSLRAEDGVNVTADKDGDAAVLKIACKDKSTFGGLWLSVPAMDLSKAPYLTVDVKCDQKIAFNMYFFDGTAVRNDGATRTTSIGGPGSGWQTVTFDFSGKGQMSTSKSQPIDSTWITQVLFNFHPSFGWPFSNWTGNIYFRNPRIGTAADMSKHNPVVTIDPIPAQVYKQGSGKHELTITGLAVANQQPITLNYETSGNMGLGVFIGEIKESAAVLTLNTAPTGTGRSTITLKATAPGADAATATFMVDVVDDSTPRAVSIDAGKTFQTIRGFGSINGPDIELYTKELGASAMRIGNECDFNPRKDTSDINVLNRNRLDYKVIDFDYYRKMKAAGVETFFYTAWTPPPWQKSNFSANYMSPAGFGDSNQCLNRLDYDCYADYAKTLVALVRMLQEEAGITLDAISLQNEPCFCESYGSAILDPRHMVQLINIVGARFAKEGIHTRLLMPEQVFTQANMLDYIRVLNNDATAQKYCDIVATHGYDDKGVVGASPDFSSWANMFQLAQQGIGPKELWMSETTIDYTGWKSAMEYDMALYAALEHGSISLWTQYGMEGTLLNHNMPNNSFWAVRQYFKFIRPGAKRVASSVVGDKLFVTSYVNDEKHGGKMVSVLTNRSDRSTVVQLNVAGRNVSAWQIITTDQVRHGAVIGDLKADAPLLLPPDSVTTAVEK